MIFHPFSAYRSFRHWLRNFNSNYLIPISGISAIVIICLGLLASGSHYTRPMHYSPRNHFISELGLAKASQYAYLFNFSLNIAGILLMYFVFGLGRYLRNSPLVKPATLIGMTATLSFSAVGYYPADHWVAHRNAASLFFTGAMISIVLFSYAIWKNRQHKLHHFISFQGFLIAFLFFVVLLWPKDLLFQSVHNPETFVRPSIWGLTVLEWMYCAFIGSWIFSVSADLLYKIQEEESGQAQHRSSANSYLGR